MTAIFMRIPGKRVRDAVEAAEEALVLVREIKRLVDTSFEESLRTGVLEELLEKLDMLVGLLLSYGFENTRYAKERASLLARYAHAIRVRIRARPEGTLHLRREHNDFKNHLDYIEAVLVEVAEIASTLPRQREESP